MRVVISGCSGGGKSTLLDMMGANGFQVFQEPGRQIVKEQLNVNGTGLPWKDPMLFARLCLARCIDYYQAADENRFPALYDRSCIDAISALESMGCEDRIDHSNIITQYRYHKKVYFTPPWKAIFSTDEERRHSFADSVREYERLLKSYSNLGYEIVEIPKSDRATRYEYLKQSILKDWELTKKE